jgi:pimeloyl-ACP methyl ester carboxylesterase
MRFEVDAKSVNATTGGAELDPSLPLLVFIHGAGGDRTIWSLQTRYFAHHGWSVLALDLPGHGGSNGPVLETTHDAAEWTGRAIEAAGFDRAAVVGHSLGAFVGLDLAAHHPEVVTRLALVGVAATMPVHPALLGAAQANDHLAVEFITSWSFTNRSQLGGHPTPGTWMTGRNSRLTERTLERTLGVDLSAANGYTDGTAMAQRVACPVLFLLGERDQMTPVRAATDLIDATPNATVTVLAGSGHMMMWDQPDAVIDALAGFLAVS